MFLYGKNSIRERLRYDPKSIRSILLQDNFKDPWIEKLIKSKKIKYRILSPKQLQKIKPNTSLQGVAAEVGDFKYYAFTDLLNRKDKLTFIFLDRISDPQNFGALIRSAACFGKFGIVIAKHKTCPVTDTVLHVACGGENFTPIAMVTNLKNTLLEAKRNDYWAAGAVAEGGKRLDSTELPFPLCFVLGSEGSGVRYGLDKHLDLKLNIPMEGAKLSFNVGVAGAIFCYEAAKQRG